MILSMAAMPIIRAISFQLVAFFHLLVKNFRRTQVSCLPCRRSTSWREVTLLVKSVSISIAIPASYTIKSFCGRPEEHTFVGVWQSVWETSICPVTTVSVWKVYTNRVSSARCIVNGCRPLQTGLSAYPHKGPILDPCSNSPSMINSPPNWQRMPTPSPRVASKVSLIYLPGNLVCLSLNLYNLGLVKLIWFKRIFTSLKGTSKSSPSNQLVSYLNSNLVSLFSCIRKCSLLCIAYEVDIIVEFAHISFSNNGDFPSGPSYAVYVHCFDEALI